MGQIKKRQCPSCGGNLIDDSEKQIYRCASCGSTYDYDYFREEQLHAMGETYLSRGEVKAAVDAYRLILKKSPHDFLALRGLMLAAAYLRDMDGFARMGEAKHFSYDPQLTGEVLDAASEEDKEYFSEIGKIYADKKQLIDRNREIESLHREREKTEADIRFTDKTRYEYYIETKRAQFHPRSVFIAVWCFTALYFVPSFIGIFDNIDEDGLPIFFVVVCGLALLFGCGFNFLIVYPKMRMIKRIDADIRNLKAESEATAGKIRALEAEAEKLSDDIRKAIWDLIRTDRRIVTDSVKEQVPEFGKIKQHQCPSCGGSLRIDRDKQMYHCTFCGSTYDYEYFREDRIHEAGETYLSRGEFMATTEAYELMLKKDPHDFLALRGLMLAAAHLTDMSELEQVDKDFSYDSRMVSRVIESASEEDKKYFTEFAKIYSDNKRLADCSEEIEALRVEKNKINSTITQNNKEGNNGKGGFSTRADLIFLLVVFLAAGAFFSMMTRDFAKELIDDYASNSEYVATEFRFVVFLGIISLFFVVGGILFFCSDMRRIKKLEKNNAEFYGEARRIDDKIKALENESSELTGDIRRFIHEFVRKDKLIMRDNKRS
jgi:ribosomal protein L37AE/L43A